MPLYIQRLTNTAKIPTRATDRAAGLDLYADAKVTIFPGARALVSTGIAVAIDPGQAGFIWPRSGMAMKFAMDTGAGLIDEDYRGEIRVLLFNHSDDPYYLEQGDRIAQLVIQPVMKPTIYDVVELPETERGESGFGSSGV